MSFSKNPAAVVLAGILSSTAVIAGGDFFYPPAGRTEAQQRQDRFECHEWAVAQSKFDPAEFAARQVPVNAIAATHESDASRQAGRSMIGGAATGALIGEAVDNDADKGAITGGAAGLLRGRLAEQKAAAERSAAQARQREQQALAAQDVRVKQQDYARARGTCFKARGYTVSEG